MAKGETSGVFARLSSDLADLVRLGTPISGAIDEMRERIAGTGSIEVCRITQVVNSAGWRLHRSGMSEMSEALVRGLSETEWNDGTRRLLRSIFEGGSHTGEVRKTGAAPDISFERGRDMIREGRIMEGVNLVKAATGEHAAAFVELGGYLLRCGYPREAVEVIEPILAMGMVRHATGGFEMGALYLLAKCAREDQSLKRKLYDEVERLRLSGELPSEYCERVFFLYRTGKVFDPSKYRRIAERYGGKNWFRVHPSTKEQLKKTPMFCTQIVGGLPELDTGSDAQERFESLMGSDQVLQAFSLLLGYRGKVGKKVYKLYEHRIVSALATGEYEPRTYEDIVRLDPRNNAIMNIAMRNLLRSNSFEDAPDLFPLSMTSPSSPRRAVSPRKARSVW